MFDLHKLNTFAELEQETNKFADLLYMSYAHVHIVRSGEPRNTISGSDPLNSPVKYSLSGVAAVLDHIRKESNLEPKLGEYHGTWFGPLDRLRNTMSLEESIRPATIAKLQSVKTKEEYAQSIYEDMQTRDYIMLYFRLDADCKNLSKTLTEHVSNFINELNRDIVKAYSKDEIITAIAKFIQNTLRNVHFFNDSNHRVFAKDVLNFLLLKYNVGVCQLKERRVIIMYSLDEFISSIKANLIPTNNKQTLCEVLRTEVRALLKESSLQKKELFSYHGTNKHEFLAALTDALPKLKRADILNLFKKIKQRDGQYEFLHDQTHKTRDKFFLFFKSSANGESNFWHTKTYQTALGMLKKAFLASEEREQAYTRKDEDNFLNYVRGNNLFNPSNTRSSKEATKLNLRRHG